LIGASHPGFPQILDCLGDKAMGKISLQAASGDHDLRS